MQPSEVRQLGPGGHALIQAALLGHVADPHALGGSDRPILPAHLALIGLQQTAHDPHRGRLTRPVATHESIQRAPGHAEAEAIEGSHRARRALQIAQLEHVACAPAHPSAT